MRAEPKIETAGRSIRWIAWKPARNSDAISETSESSVSVRRRSRRSSSALRRSQAVLRDVGGDHAEHERRRSSASEATATTAASRRASAGSVRPPPARRTRHERRTWRAVEERDRDEVDQVEEEAGVGERAQRSESSATAATRQPAAAIPPATGPASETRAFTHGSKRMLRSATYAPRNGMKTGSCGSSPAASPRCSGRARGRGSAGRSRRRTSSPRSARSRRRRGRSPKNLRTNAPNLTSTPTSDDERRERASRAASGRPLVLGGQRRGLGRGDRLVAPLVVGAHGPGRALVTSPARSIPRRRRRAPSSRAAPSA